MTRIMGISTPVRLALALTIIAAPLTAFAQASTPAAFVLNSGDTAWMLTSTALVLMMTLPGLALFYGGMVRRKNVVATVAQSFAITRVVTLAWFAVGYSIAFGTNPDAGQNRVWGGLGDVMLRNLALDKPYVIAGVAYGVPEYVYMMFRMTFAIITQALICGAFAERFKFSALLLFTCFGQSWSTPRSPAGSGEAASWAPWG